MTDTVEKVPLAARLGQWMFPRRVLIPIPLILLALLVIHPRHMFGDRAALGMTLSAVLVSLGVGLRVWGGGCAGWHTRGHTIGAPQLTTCGPYAYVRNPIYLGNMILGLGMVGLIGDPWLFVLYLAAM